MQLKMISTQNTKFNPNGSVTRVEALKMILLLFIWEVWNNYTKNIWDVSGKDWYAKYVEYALNNNFFSLSNNLFFPNKEITRYEVINILKQMIQK